MDIRPVPNPEDRWVLRALIIFGLLASSAPAFASATFRWQTTAGNGCCEATIVITDEAYAAGFFSTHIAHDGAAQAIPTSPVVKLEITVYGDHLVFDRERVR